MKLSQQWKDQVKPEGIDQEELTTYLSEIENYGSKITTDPSVYREGDWQNCPYKIQADKIIDKLVRVSNIGEFDRLKEQFKNYKLPGSTRDNTELIKSSAEALCYLIEKKELPITDSFRNAVLASTLDACAPGAAGNMQIILSELQPSDYDDKMHFIKEKIAADIGKISSNPNYHIHAAQEVMFLLEGDYKTDYNKGDHYAQYTLDPNTSPHYAKHRQFKRKLDQLVSSKKGVHEYINSIATKEIINLPNGGEAGEFNYYQEILDKKSGTKMLMPSEELQKVTMLATKLGIVTDDLIKIEYTDDINQKFTFKANYQETIAAAITYKLISEGLVDHNTIKIRREEIKNNVTIYDLAEPDQFKALMQIDRSGEILTDLIQTKGTRLNRLLESHQSLKGLFTQEQLEQLQNTNVKTPLLDRQHRITTITKITHQDQVLESPNGWFIKEEQGFEKIFDSLKYKALTFNDTGIEDFIYNTLYEQVFEPNADIRSAINLLIESQFHHANQENLGDPNLYTIEQKLIIGSDQGRAIMSKGFRVEEIAKIELSNLDDYVKFAKIEDPQKAFLFAVRVEKDILLKKAIDRGADINAKYRNNGTTALIDAIFHDKIALVESLLHLGADINVKANDGSTVLMYAVARGHIALVESLLHLGADVNAKDNGGWTVLMRAAYRGHIELVNILLVHRADINAKDNHGNTALIHAVSHDNIALVESLLHLGADVNAQNNYGQTALMRAAYRGHIELVNILLGHRADINAKDDRGNTALIEAVSHDNIELVNILLGHRADINAKDNRGNTALMKAASLGYEGLVERLIELRADVNAQNNDGQTALMKASSEFNDHIKLMLCPEDSKVNLATEVITRLIKDGAGLFKDNPKSWNEVKKILDNLPDKQVDIVSNILPNISNSTRQDQLLNMLSQDKQNLIKENLPKTIWQELKNTMELMHGNSSVDTAPPRQNAQSGPNKKNPGGIGK